MSEEFVKYFNRELAFLRHQGQKFGEKHPKIAARLGIREEKIEDPHVSRVLEGCAFLTAKIRQELDNSYPKFSQAIMGQLYPDFHAPIPSMSVIKVTGANNSATPVNVETGECVELDGPNAVTCKFRTCYDNLVMPIDVSSASFENAPFNGVGHPNQKLARSVLKVTVGTTEKSMALSDVKQGRFRFFLNGQQEISFKLYQLIFQYCIGLSVVTGKGSNVVHHHQRKIKPVGFSKEEQVVPYSKRSFVGTRLLVEYLHFPEKFLFLDLDDIDTSGFGDEKSAEFWFYFSESEEWLEKQVNSDCIKMGCTPVINLFSAVMEPTRLTPNDYDYPLEASYYDSENHELVSVDSVSVKNWNKTFLDIPPYYGGHHTHFSNRHNIYWVLNREDKTWSNGYEEAGREVRIAFVDSKQNLFKTNMDEDWIMMVEAECCNRNQPKKIPFGGQYPRVTFPDLRTNVESVECLTQPTETVRPPMDESVRWQLTQLLGINRFNHEQGVENLKQLIGLYAFKGGPQTKVLIDSIENLEMTETTGRVNHKGRIGVCHGTKIIVTVSERVISKEHWFFFGNILSSYFAQLVEVNTFSQLEIKLSSNDEVFHCWPTMCGAKVMV